jgi:small subunit ribosomal protein S20
MPHSVSAAKRVRQNEKHRLYNKSIRTGVRGAIKRFRGLVEEGKLDEARAAYSPVVRKIDQAAAKGVLHKNTAGRYKSRLALLINRSAKGSAAPTA